jgi:hypothetical protein
MLGRGNSTGAARRGRPGGVEKLENKRRKEAKDKLQGRLEDRAKEEAVEKSKRPMTEEGNEAQEQHEEGVGGSTARTVSREDHNMVTIMRLIEEREQREKTVETGPCFTQV